MSWTLIPIEGNWFYIKNRKSGQYLCVAGGSTNDSVQVVQWTLVKGDHQFHWSFDVTGRPKNNLVTIKNRKSGKLMSLATASTKNGIRIVQNPLGPNPQHQVWRVIEVK